MGFTDEQISDIKKMFVYIEHPPEFKFYISETKRRVIDVNFKEYGVVFNDAHIATIKRILNAENALEERGKGKDYDGWPTLKIKISCW